jgi:hypothetical protein
MSHAERPWRLADANRIPGASAPIANEWIREYFLEADAADRAEEPVFDSAEKATLLAGAPDRLAEPATERVTAAQLRARLAEMAAARG